MSIDFITPSSRSLSDGARANTGPASATSGAMNDVPRQPVLLIVDGTYLVRRVYEAVPVTPNVAEALKSRDAEAVELADPQRVEGAMKSAWSSMLRAIKEIAPTHVLVSFDAGGHTWRHDLYPQYKAHRKPMPGGLREAIPDFIERLNGAGIRAVQLKHNPGVETDDVIGTLSTKALARGFDVVVAANDKDMLCLVDAGVRMREHFKSEWRDESWVQNKYGIPSRLIPDMLALLGDETDGIPGVLGIGPKTAPKLLNEYGDIEGVLAAAQVIANGGTPEARVAPVDALAGAAESSSKSVMSVTLAKKLVEQQETARLSKTLATLRRDVKLGLSPNDIRLPMPAHLLGQSGKAADSGAPMRHATSTTPASHPELATSTAQAAATEVRRSSRPMRP